MAKDDSAASQSGAARRPDSKFLDTSAQLRGGDTSPARPPTGATSAVAWVGRLLGKYQITAVLGQGGMGTVFRAHDPLIDRDVAIKLLSEEMAEDETALGRFLAEAKAVGKLNHANVVSVYDVGQDGKAYYLVMELMPGGSASDGLDAGRASSVLEATKIAIDACKGLAAAHAAGLIHRDIKPANLMRSADGTFKITDFGLAKPTSPRAREITQAGMVIGTPYFMSPEQCGASPVDARTDIYSLGATYYALLTGKHPYEDSQSVIQVLFGHSQGEIPNPREANPSIPQACTAIVARAMAKSPDDRYQSAGEMLADLEAVAGTLSGPININLPSQTGVRRGATASATHAAARSRGGSPRKSRRIGFIVGVAATILVAIALGIWRPWSGSTGDSSGSNKALAVTPGSNSSGPMPAVPGVAAGEIVLGMSAPFNGPSRELGRSMQIGLNAFFEDVNARGGIAGRKIRLVALDDGYEPDRALANMNLLFDKHKVFAFIGNVGTPTAERAVPFALEKKMLFFGPFTGAKLVRKDPPDRFVFNYRASYEEETAAILKYLVEIKKIRPDQVAVFAQQDAYGDSGFNGVVKMLRKLSGDPDKLLRVGYVRNTVDVADAVKKIVAAPDLKAVIMVPTYRPAARFIQAVKDAGKNLTFASVSFVGAAPLAEELSQLGPKYGDGVIVTEVVPHPESQASAVLKYRELLSKYYPSEKPSFISLEGYIDAMIFAHALELAGEKLTTDSVIAAIESIHNLDLGIGVPINFGPSDHQASHKVWGTVLGQDGQYQILDLE